MMDGDKGQMFAKQVRSTPKPRDNDQIVNTGQRNEARKALEEIQSRHRDVVRIEKSILELQQLFMDMAVLVAAQGEVVDQIAIHVEEAVKDTDAGVTALHNAVELQKKSRKKMCMIMLILAAIISMSFGVAR